MHLCQNEHMQAPMSSPGHLKLSTGTWKQKHGLVAITCLAVKTRDDYNEIEQQQVGMLLEQRNAKFLPDRERPTQSKYDDSLPDERALNLPKVDLNANGPKEQGLDQDEPHHCQLAITVSRIMLAHTCTPSSNKNLSN